jgi:threonine/homoserine/homoserine lactone efflux protein
VASFATEAASNALRSATMLVRVSNWLSVGLFLAIGLLLLLSRP